jgi:pimeloyl-ACP methyl ester carboxylesterase
MAVMADIHLLDSGPESGPSTVLCLHGIGSSSQAFAHQVRAFPPRARAVAWDAPGYGMSGDPQEPLTLADYVAAAAEVVERLATGPVHLLGASWGGVIACALAAERPELVRGLILVDSSPGAGTAPEQAENMRARARDFEALGATAFAEQRAPKLVSGAAPAALVTDVAEAMSANVRMPGYGYAVECMASTDLRPLLPGIGAPTLVVCGDLDDVTGLPQSQILAGGIPHAVLVTIHGAGHLANQERPATFNHWVLAYLDIAESQRRG